MTLAIILLSVVVLILGGLLALIWWVDNHPTLPW